MNCTLFKTYVICVINHNKLFKMFSYQQNTNKNNCFNNLNLNCKCTNRFATFKS